MIQMDTVNLRKAIHPLSEEFQDLTSCLERVQEECSREASFGFPFFHIYPQLKFCFDIRLLGPIASKCRWLKQLQNWPLNHV